MNFEKMIDGMIAERIVSARKKLSLTQEQFCEKFESKVSIDKFRLSNLENGRRNKTKNPHFLTEAYIEFYRELLGGSTKNFLFGDEENRDYIIKIVLLNIFMNASQKSKNGSFVDEEQNPLFDLGMESDAEFFRLAKTNLDWEKQQELYLMASSYRVKLELNDDKLDFVKMKHDRKRIEQFLENRDCFFYNKKTAKYYRFSMDGKSIFSEQSSILLRCLLGNFDFASNFLDRCDRRETTVVDGLTLRNPNEKDFYIDNYLQGIGSFSMSAIDRLENYYYKFIVAFNEFVSIHIETFRLFFEQHIFNKSSLKELSNSYINQLFSDNGFLQLINDIYLKDQFIMERMVGHNFSRAMIQKFALIQKDSEKLLRRGKNFPSKGEEVWEFYNFECSRREQDGYTLDKYLHDFENMTLLYASPGQPHESAKMYLKDYFRI